jgi:mRNA-degrading endonuclease RelE of RelBE toxin-antitoxin system
MTATRRLKWEVGFRSPALKVLRALPKRDLQRVQAVLDRLAEDALPPEALPVIEFSREHVFVLPVEGFRIYYIPDTRDATVDVLTVEPLERRATKATEAASTS